MPARNTALPQLQIRMTALAVDDNGLKPGTCGVVRGIAVRYDVVDSYGTVFKRGSLDKTRAKVNRGSVKLFDNHGSTDWYGTRSHVGTVRTLSPNGDGEEMSAEIFDTEEGRRVKEYLAAVMLSGGETGLSIGFYERAGGWAKRDDKQIYEFSEVELDEISLAPRNAVPGADVTGVRALSGDVRQQLAQQLARGLTLPEWTALYPAADDESQRAAPNAGSDELPTPVSMSERLLAYRRSLHV